MTAEQKGTLIWVTGLAGSGKTTLGKDLQSELRKSGLSCILLDGDQLREITGGIFGYTLEERKLCAEFYSRLCEVLTRQGVNVICCTISMFDSVRQMNRSQVQNYFEIYLKADPKLLASRNQKNLYTAGKGVMGVDLEIEEPKAADLTFNLGENGLPLSEMSRTASNKILQRLSGGRNEVFIEG